MSLVLGNFHYVETELCYRLPIIINSWRFQPQGRDDLFGPDLDRAFGSRGGGGITPLYGLCWYARPQGVWFSSGFGLKKGTDFDHVHSRFSLIRHFIYKELFLPCQSLFK